MMSFRNSVTATKLCSSSRAAFRTSFCTTRSALDQLNLGLRNVDLGPGNVSLIAVVEGDRQSCAQSPRVSTGDAKVGVVLKGIGLIKDVGVGITVRSRQLEIGLGPTKAVPEGNQIGPAGNSPFDQFFLGNRKWLQLADRVEHVEPFDVVQRHVQHERKSTVRRDLGLLRFFYLELRLEHVGLDRVQIRLLNLPVLVKLISDREKSIDPRQVDLAKLQGQARGDDPLINRVQVVDLVPHRILKLRFCHAFGLACRSRGADRLKVMSRG